MCQRLAKYLQGFIVGELAIGIHTGKCLIAHDEGDRQGAARIDEGNRQGAARI